MPRRPRHAPGGLVYHVLNRSVGRLKMFRTDPDFLAFQRLLVEAHERHPIRILGWCVMGTHWHLVVWPRTDGEVTAFFRWLAHSHAMRWRVAHRTVGYGHLYRGRFKSFPVQSDEHLLWACRYVERNPLAAGLVRRAEDWRWSSLWARRHGPAELRGLLSDWPVDRPANWVRLVNQPWTDKELARVQLSVERSQPLGQAAWAARTAKALHLEHTLRSPGRPRNAPAAPPKN